MKSDLLKEFSVFELRKLHEKKFNEWIATGELMDELKGKEIDTYKESVQRDWDLNVLFNISKELHKDLVLIDNELQLRIWEGKID